MTRSKLRVVQSYDEYMTEEHNNTTHEDAESSDFQHLSCNGEEGLTDSDDEEDEDDHDHTSDDAQDENAETEKRGRTKLRKTWDLPKGQRIVVRCNDLNQPIGKEGGRLGYFLGTLARNGKLCSLSYTDWRKLIGETDKNNEQKNKKDILGQVKMRFLYPSRLEKYILKTIGERWRQHKCNLKSLFFDASKSMEANNTNVPKGVIKDQWISLVSNWMSQKAQDISEKNRENSTIKKSIHTAGTKSFARNREELVELKKTLANRSDLADTSKGTAWKGDALNTILGADKPGHIHGLGLVPHANQVFGVSSSSHFQDMHLTSLEDTRNEDLLSIRLQLEMMQKHMKSHDAKFLELTEKTGSVDHISTSRDALCVAQTNSKRKKVYGDFQSQQLGSCGQRNSAMSEENFLNDMEMQPSNKRPATDKNKGTSVHKENVRPRKEGASAEMDLYTEPAHDDTLQHFKAPSGHMHGGQNMKIPKRTSATKHATNKETLVHDEYLHPRKETASAEKHADQNMKISKGASATNQASKQ